jgi:hypothetical protein
MQMTTMIGRIIINPDSKTLAVYGPLAHVAQEERKAIMGLPEGQFKPALARLEREIAEAKKRHKKKNNVEFQRVMGFK